ncbi:RidA family protein [Pseudomonas kuykendallii]|uniref:Enamine deaminase RidA, house cleaning of reactive enamine intermediates, YjgF/YER057c/UK114 family n=1 Tax=Pseudomonas kuykendallii TaxID=1007099 RepID=A0A1H2ZLF0_9PSED|nr:RidA family protein [Pseudomonas kuykendallii]MCQ4271411.1 RidA family protein [Pseudomonas kuykendallii]SDX18270.1 Enamine deaminase RidA, house cleaning of reactive enamine intermediates, YjgF/YER057c/UK114 family [Pseudomonas kuykendallii]
MSITRHDSGARMSRAVVHNGTVYLAGVIATDRSGDIRAQTADVLARLDGFLTDAGTDKSRLLSAQIWLKDIDRDFSGMNEVWDAWVAADAAPARATCQARLASPDLLVEIIVTAAL